jgi:hypothetical protein
VFDERRRGAAPCRRVRDLVVNRLTDLDRRLEELTVLRRDLTVLLDEWEQRLARTPPGRRAYLLDMLADESDR